MQTAKVYCGFCDFTSWVLVDDEGEEAHPRSAGACTSCGREYGFSDGPKEVTGICPNCKNPFDSAGHVWERDVVVGCPKKAA